jgi:hypothetical protein
MIKRPPINKAKPNNSMKRNSLTRTVRTGNGNLRQMEFEDGLHQPQRIGEMIMRKK